MRGRPFVLPVIACVLAFSLNAADRDDMVTLSAKAVRVDGSPAPGVSVEFVSQERQLRGRPEQIWRGRTDDKGELKIAAPAADVGWPVRCNVLSDPDAKFAPTAISPPQHGSYNALIILGPASAELKGIVRDADNKPVGGAVMTLISGQGSYTRTGTTDTLGQYAITGLAAGAYTVRQISAPAGSPWIPLSEWRGLQRVTLSTGQSAQADFQLPRGARISGRVLDDDGRPIAGAEINCHTDEASAVRDGGRQRAGQSFGCTARTGADGRYVLSALSPETYCIEIKSPVAATAAARLRGIDLHADDITVQDVAVGLGATIAGTVLADGQPQAGIEIMLHSREPQRWTFQEGGLFATTGADGKFTFNGVESGAHKLTATPPKGAAWIPTDFEFTVVRGFTVNPALNLSSGMTVKGLVTDPDGKPVPQAYVDVQLAEKYGSSVSYRGRADAGGRYTVTGVYAPKYCDPTKAWRVRSSPHSADGALMFGDTGIQKPEAGKMVEANVTLQRGVCFKGIVRGPDGKPLAGCRIAAVQRTRGGYSSHSGGQPTDGAGSYAMWGLIPASWSVTVYPPEELNLLPWSDAQKDFVAGTHTIDVTLKTGAAITGKVQTQKNAPLPYASVRLENMGNDDRVPGYRDYGFEVRAAADGVYKVPGLAPGKYKLTCTPLDPSFGHKVIEVTVPAEGDVLNDFVF